MVQDAKKFSLQQRKHVMTTNGGMADMCVVVALLQVDRMVQDAEKFSDEDKKQREAVDIRNSVRSPDSCNMRCLLQCCGLALHPRGSELQVPTPTCHNAV